jgi:hypothetical protein
MFEKMGVRVARRIVRTMGVTVVFIMKVVLLF